MSSVKDKVYNRICGHGKGWAFSNKDFSDLGSSSSVDVALHDLVAKGKVRRVARGLYDYPRQDALFDGWAPADIHQVALAMGRRSGVNVQPSGAWAANMLGLSEQVPAQIVYLTDGQLRSDVDIDGRRVQFKRVGPGKMQAGSDVTVQLTCAIRHLGEDGITEGKLRRLREQLGEKRLKTIAREAKYVERWIYEIIQKLCDGEETKSHG